METVQGRGAYWTLPSDQERGWDGWDFKTNVDGTN